MPPPHPPTLPFSGNTGKGELGCLLWEPASPPASGWHRTPRSGRIPGAQSISPRRPDPAGLLIGHDVHGCTSALGYAGASRPSRYEQRGKLQHHAGMKTAGASCKLSVAQAALAPRRALSLGLPSKIASAPANRVNCPTSQLQFTRPQ